MGLAVLWIAVYHSYFPIPLKSVSFLLATCGYGGVDLFLFLSGFGIYFAAKKEPVYTDFLKRRLSRILPYSMTLCVILLLCGLRTFPEFLIDFFGLSIYLRADWIWWFTSFILSLYLLTPLYMKLFRRSPVLTTCFALLLFHLLCSQLPTYDYVYVYYRVNIYILGIFYGWLSEKKDVPLVSWFSLAAMVFGWAFIYYCYHHFGNGTGYVVPFLFISPGLALFLSKLFDLLPFLAGPLNFIGRYSYQYHLLHIEILNRLLEHYGDWYRPGIHYDWLINLAGILLTFLAAVLLKETVDFVLARIIKRGTHA